MTKSDDNTTTKDVKAMEEEEQTLTIEDIKRETDRKEERYQKAAKIVFFAGLGLGFILETIISKNEANIISRMLTGLNIGLLGNSIIKIHQIFNLHRYRKALTKEIENNMMAMYNSFVNSNNQTNPPVDTEENENIKTF